jgi:centrosomal protein CEP164
MADSIILEEQIDESYVPTQDEVHEYAKWLGMDLQQDKDLFWIAREGLKAPLPADWKPCKTVDTEEIYYFNFATGASTWDHPCDEYYKELYSQEKAKAKRPVGALNDQEANEKKKRSRARARAAWKRAAQAVSVAKFLFDHYIERREDDLFASSGGIPDSLVCPITYHLFRQPVVAADGFTYEREAIAKWFIAEGRRGSVVRSPKTNLPMKSKALTENTALRILAEDMVSKARETFCAAQLHEQAPSEEVRLLMEENEESRRD